MYSDGIIDFNGYFHARMESVQHVGLLKLYSERWLVLYILFSIVVGWEIRRMMVIFRKRCPVRSSY